MPDVKRIALASLAETLPEKDARALLADILQTLDRPTVVWSLRVLAVQQIADEARAKLTVG